MSERARLSVAQRMEVIALIARGDGNPAILQYISDNFEMDMTESAISKIKSVHKDIIKSMRDKMLDAQAKDAEAVMKRARAHINRRLYKAELDADTLEALDQQYRDGELSRDEYRKRKTGLLQLSIAELTRISAAMHTQTKTDPLAPELPSLPPSTQQPTAVQPNPQLETMLKALQDGDTVTLQQIRFGKGVKNDSPVGVPVEPTPAS